MPITLRRRGLARVLAPLLLAAAIVAAPLTTSTPAVAAAPEDTSPADVTVMPGQSATFALDASPAYSVSWYRVGSSNPIAFNKTSYTIDAVTEADDGAQFYAKYYDASFSQVQSRTATLTVGTGELTFASQPADLTVFATRSATFSASARGSSPISYQWESSDDDGATWTVIDGATDASLTFRASQEQDGRLLRVVADNPVSEPLVSHAARLTVRPQDTQSIAVTDASFLWGLNPIYQGGNPAGNGCNNFSAGTQLEFAAVQGDVRIVHETPDGLISVSDGTKCTDQAAGGMQQRVLLTHGSGTANPETGVASIQWKGAFLANAYGGLVPWWLQDLALTVEADGTGTLTATGGGYGSDMDDPENMHPIAARPVVVATFQDVVVNDEGIVVQPDYEGVEITVPEGVDATPQNRSKKGWGAWPQSFVDLHFDTALSSYWYTSGLSADPDKPPFPFTVTFLKAPAVRELPSISSGPVLEDGAPIVNGRTAKATAKVDDFDRLTWEAADDPYSGTWTAIDGASSQELEFTASAEWNGRYVRVVAANSAGSASSAPLRIETRDFAAPSFTSQPTPVAAFDGERALITARADGFPEVDADSYRVELSLDEGKTWTIVEDAFRTSGDTFAIPSANAAHDGGLLRVAASTKEGREAGSPGSSVTSQSVPFTVLPATEGPQLAVLPAGEIDPTAATTLTVIGKGFSLPDETGSGTSSSIDLALFEADQWTPGTGGLTRVEGIRYSPSTWIGGGAVYRGYLEDRGGTLSVSVTIPAGTLDATKVYGIGAYTRLTNLSDWSDSWEDRSNDAWTPVLLAGQTAAQITAQPQSVILPEAGGTARLEVGVSGAPEPTVSWERLDGDSWVTVEGATTAVLEVPLAAHAPSETYRAVVTNRLSKEQKSHSATVSITRHEPVESDLGAETEGLIQAPKTVVQGEQVTIKVGEQLAAQVVEAVVFSEPTSLGTSSVAANGTIEGTIPSTLSLGGHRLAVYTAQGDLVGWQRITVVAPSTRTDDAPSGSTDAGGLAVTGGAVPALALGLGVLASISGAVLAARRRRLLR